MFDRLSKFVCEVLADILVIDILEKDEDKNITKELTDYKYLHLPFMWGLKDLRVMHYSDQSCFTICILSLEAVRRCRYC